MSEPSPKRQRAIFDLIFELGEPAQEKSALSRLSFAVSPWLIAILIHGGLLFVAVNSEPSLESWSARMATLIHSDLAEQTPIKVEPLPVIKPPEPAPPPPVEEPPKIKPVAKSSPPKAKVKRKRIRRTKTKRSKVKVKVKTPAKPSSNAQAGKLLTAEPSAARPVDLTETLFVTGSGQKFAGGVTSAEGTSTTAVTEPKGEEKQVEPTRPSQARSVSLSGGEWRCAWPQTAINQEIYEQDVILKVVVNAEGSVKKVKIIKDPGHGFGSAATSCALQTRFTPALNRNGEPISATSPPIKVRFTR